MEVGMYTARILFLNKQFVAWDQANVHLMSHSFGRGSAIFEVLSLHPAIQGPAVFRLSDHIDRFFTSAKLLCMELPLSGPDLHTAVLDTVKKNDLKQGFLKIIGFYPQIALDILPPAAPLDVAVFALDPAADFDQPPKFLSDGATLGLSTWRKLHPQTVPVAAKAAANYLNGMVARLEARQRGYDYALMLDSQGFLAEGGTESIFLVNDGCLMTPSLGTVLDSITRRSLLSMAEKLDIKIWEGRLPVDLLYSADEIFLSGTPAKLSPIKQVENRIMPDAPGPITRKLMALMDEILEGRDGRFKNWLFYAR
jgi:branched-chain amino acid aminotransferase